VGEYTDHREGLWYSSNSCKYRQN